MNGYDERQYLDILRANWGYPGFRGIQREIISSIASGNDTLGLMPTGGGKSITFQVPALANEGTCIVITPLIALMKDQVDNLRRKGILAAAVYSGMPRRDILAALDNCILGSTKLLYVSPERIASELFQTKLAHMRVSFITVDEAHCISQWGYDFRPSYLRIADIRKLKPDAPILALTATATPQVVDDIQARLGFARSNVFSMSFERKNLAYVVRHTDNKQGELLHILNSVQGSAIVYVRSRNKTKETSEWLEAHNISSTYYHAGLEHSTKDERQKAWHDDEKRVMVATNAFGMGIDKPDVRLVVHTDSPSSIEAYFQEAGRAGRDGHKSYAVLLYSDNDTALLKKRVTQEFPTKDEIRDIYEHLAFFLQIAAGTGYGRTFAFDIGRFCQAFHHFPLVVNSALKILARAGYINYDIDPNSLTRLRFTLDRDQLYQLTGNSANEDAVIAALLRTYSGLFVDYRYIEESVIAQKTALTRQQVYLILKSLSQRHILHFIPPQSDPLITYTHDRLLREDIVLPPQVYEERKTQFANRIQHMISYATTDYVCRSRQLMRYFGQNDTTDCGQCDVCIAHSHDHSDTTEIHLIKAKIAEMLADGKRHNITEITALSGNRQQVVEAVEQMLAEEAIKSEADTLYA